MTEEFADPQIWNYRARCTRIVDGDTLDLVVDVGFYLHSTIRVRLARIDAPEKRGYSREAGLAAERAVKAWMPAWGFEMEENPWPLVIHTEKAGPFGRWIAEVHKWGDPTSLSDHLVDKGHAEYREY